MVKIYIKYGNLIHIRTFIATHPLESYYLNQAGCVLSPTPEIGPIPSAPLYLQRGRGIGNFFGSFFRLFWPIFWSVAKAVGRVTSRTGGKILTHIVENK